MRSMRVCRSAPHMLVCARSRSLTPSVCSRVFLGFAYQSVGAFVIGSEIIHGARPCLFRIVCFAYRTVKRPVTIHGDSRLALNVERARRLNGLFRTHRTHKYRREPIEHRKQYLQQVHAQSLVACMSVSAAPECVCVRIYRSVQNVFCECKSVGDKDKLVQLQQEADSGAAEKNQLRSKQEPCIRGSIRERRRQR